VADNVYWLPLILQGKRIEAMVTFKADNETVDAVNMREI
jgi:hypothetical protein